MGVQEYRTKVAPLAPPAAGTEVPQAPAVTTKRSSLTIKITAQPVQAPLERSWAAACEKNDQKTSQGRPRTTIPRVGQLAQRAGKGTKGPPGATTSEIEYLCGTWAHGGAWRCQRTALERRYRKPSGQGPELAAEASLGRGGLGRQGRPAALRGQARAAQTRAARGAGRRWRPQRRGHR